MAGFDPNYCETSNAKIGVGTCATLIYYETHYTMVRLKNRAVDYQKIPAINLEPQANAYGSFV